MSAPRPPLPRLARLAAGYPRTAPVRTAPATSRRLVVAGVAVTAAFALSSCSSAPTSGSTDGTGEHSAAPSKAAAERTGWSSDDLCDALVSIDPSSLVGTAVRPPDGTSGSGGGACSTDIGDDSVAMVSFSATWNDAGTADNAYETLVESDDTPIAGLGDRAVYSSGGDEGGGDTASAIYMRSGDDYASLQVVEPLGGPVAPALDVLQQKFVAILDELGFAH
jgi:hypothetical protein